MFVLLSYLPSPYRSNVAKNFSSNIRIHESILMSSFMKHLPRSVRFRQRNKIQQTDPALKLQEQIRFTTSWKLYLNLFSLWWLTSKSNVVRSLIRRLSETLFKLLGVGFIYFSKEFLKISPDNDLQISRLQLFYSLVTYGKYEFGKHSLLQDICGNFSLFLIETYLII